LTIQNLPMLISDTKLRSKVQDQIQTILAKSDFCRDWRNRRIAHRDLAIALNGPVKALKNGSRRQVDELLDLIAEAMNSLAAHYFDSETFYRFNGHAGG